VNWTVRTLIIAEPHGFCAGVARAVETVRATLKKFPPPVFVKHAIVHNLFVVKQMEKEGAKFVESLDEIPSGVTVIFSAHGAPPADYLCAAKRKLKVIDATCPLVSKVHIEAKKFAEEGYEIIYLGHKGHIEPRGVFGEAPEKIKLISSQKEAQEIKVKNPSKVALLTQTTLSVDDTAEIRDILKRRFPKIVFPPREDICFATQSRQQAVKKLAKKTKRIIVVGSPTSSNTKRLKEAAEKAGSRAYRIENVSEINHAWFAGYRKVGLTSGASVPEVLLAEVVEYFKKRGAAVQYLQVVAEKVFFPPPRI
jgi:4-hydroxy-3-methylbut-2-enyl diphosphate reductase